MNKIKEWFSQVSNGTLVLFVAIIIAFTVLGAMIITKIDSFGKEELEMVLAFGSATIAAIIGTIRHNPVTKAGFAGADATKAYKAGIYPNDEGQGVYADIDPDTVDEYGLNNLEGDE